MARYPARSRWHGLQWDSGTRRSVHGPQTSSERNRRLQQDTEASSKRSSTLGAGAARNRSAVQVYRKNAVRSSLDYLARPFAWGFGGGYRRLIFSGGSEAASAVAGRCSSTSLATAYLSGSMPSPVTAEIVKNCILRRLANVASFFSFSGLATSALVATRTVGFAARAGSKDFSSSVMTLKSWTGSGRSGSSETSTRCTITDVRSVCLRN